MLTAADLLAAGTVDVELMAYLMWRMRRGASIITCAGPGGTGKTTLLGALLCFLPENLELRVVQGYDQYHDANVCYLCHELGRGYYSYLWGAEARALLEVTPATDRRFVATTAHADSLEELYKLLTKSEIRLSALAFAHIDLVLFMRRLGSYGPGRTLRRVTHVYSATGYVEDTHTCVSSWDGQSDTFTWCRPDGDGWEASAPMHDELIPYREFLIALYKRQTVRVADVREAVLEFYAGTK